MLLTEKQKQKYMADTSAASKLTNIQKYTEVRNVRENDNEPYVLKDVFGSKKGLLKIAANLNSDMAKIYKVANSIRKKSIAPKYLSKEYFNQLLENKFITDHEHALIIGYEKKFKMLDKKIKELGQKIYKECRKTNLTADYFTASTITASMGGYFGLVIGVGAGALLSLPLVFLFPITSMMIPSIIMAVGGVIGTVIGITVAEGFTAGAIYSDKDNYIIYDNQDKLVKEITEDLKKCQSKNLPGVPPHLLFVEDGNGNIGVPISHHLVAFEPQTDIKNFHDMYQKATEGFDNALKTTNISLFLNSSFDAKDIKRCLKMYKDHSKLVETIVPMAKKLMEDLLKKHKNKTPKQDPKGWKESDKFVYYFAEYLSKLTYKGFNTEEIIRELKEKQSMQQAVQDCKAIENFIETVKKHPNPPAIDTTPAEGVLIDVSNPKKTKSVKINPIQPTVVYDLQLCKATDADQKIDTPLQKALSTDPEDYSPLAISS